MNILLLGGTGDAQQIANILAERGHDVLYSIAGLVARPTLACRLRVGGFGGKAGLIDCIKANAIDCLIDATHPYADNISRNAVLAAQAISLPILRYTRPAWQPGDNDNWVAVADDWPAIMAAVRHYCRPLFTIGQQPLLHTDDRASHQHWLVRTLTHNNKQHTGVQVIHERGPFSYNSERALMLLNGVDVLVSKNSGGHAVAEKITAARDLRIPVLMLHRPTLVPIDSEFDSVEALLACLPVN